MALKKIFVLTVVFFVLSLGIYISPFSWLLPSPGEAAMNRYLHAETTGISDWVIFEGAKEVSLIKFHPYSDREAIETLKHLTAQCNSGESSFIFGDFPPEERMRQRIWIKGKRDLLARYDALHDQTFHYFFLYDWYIETPVEVNLSVGEIYGPNHSDKRIVVENWKDANCKDPRLEKYFRKSW